jgi:hypothetical protein
MRSFRWSLLGVRVPPASSKTATSQLGGVCNVDGTAREHVRRRGRQRRLTIPRPSPHSQRGARLRASPQPADSERLAAVYTVAREVEWVEFVAECGKYLAEIDKEIAKDKLTLAELDEEQQSPERLRRWHRELRLRDLLGAPSAAGADQRLKECQAKLEDYTQRVFHAVAGQ